MHDKRTTDESEASEDQPNAQPEPERTCKDMDTPEAYDPTPSTHPSEGGEK